ncbi:MAG TPA: alcohol dehydrogenase catalytic domain-containing protein [Vicinamibacterales bacterium]|nr:alcohol dehydrogenase catalytic domain-containing protein [Vicinamibacterales bacterium]
MRALVLDAGTLTLRDRPRPTAAGECLVRVTAAGICGTDLELLRGYAGFSGVPGHEFVGVVDEAGPADNAWIGRRVVGEITVGCERCAGCRVAGRGHCDVRTVLGIRGRDGVFAEYLSLPATNLHVVPESLDDLTAVFVEPVAAACRVVEQVHVDRDTRAAVVGSGRLGLLVAQVLRHAGAQVTVIVRGARGRPAASALGLETATLDAAATSLARHLDVAVDTTGDPAGFAVAAGLVRPRGTVVVKSTFHGETPVPFSPLVVDEITVIGSRCGPFNRALALLEAGVIDVKPLLAGTYPLAQYAQAFDRARDGLKVVLTS